MRLSRLIPAAIALSAAHLLTACEPKSAEGGETVAAESAVPGGCERARDPAAALAAMEAFEAGAIAKAKASRGAGTPALWTIRDDDTTIYIMGTVHLLRPDLEWRSAEIDAAIAAADTVVFEADTTSPEAGRELMKFFTSQGMFTDGTQLTSLLTEPEVEQLKLALEEVGLPLEAIQPMRPWYAALNMSVMQMTQEGFDPTAGVEMKVESEAGARGASFEYLETVEQQLGEFARLDSCSQVEFLMQSAESVKQGTEMLDLLVAEWADGDTAGLGSLMADPQAFGSDATYDALLKNRNERWTPMISDMLEKPGTRLIAVGAGHLAGEDSVIAMLRAKGHEVAGP